MNYLAIYELIQAYKRRKSKSKNSSDSQIAEFLSDVAGYDGRIEDITPQDISDDISKSNINSFIDLVKDKIILINDGFPKNQTLGLKYYECHKLYLLAEILNTLLFKRAALATAEKVVKISKKYFFLNLTFQAYRIIYQTKLRLNDEKGEIKANREFLRYLKFYEIEKLMEIEYNALFKKLNYSKEFNKDTAEFSDRILERFKSHEGIIPSFHFHFHYYYIQYISSSHRKKHSEVPEIARKALWWFDNQEFNYIPGKLTFIFILIVHMTQRREFDEGIILIEKAKALISRRSPQWFRVKENEFILYCHKGDYEKTVNIYLDVFNNKAFVTISPNDKNRWLLYEAYINLIIETGSSPYFERRKRFSVQKFINELPDYSKDKRAMNIPILIAQMLFFIVRRQYNHAIDRIEALEKYTSRYLRNDETFRSNCFIKMVLEIPKNSFNQLRVERAAQKYFERLLDSEIELINQPFEIEIIPYERLWAMVMNHLRADHHYSPKRARVA